MKAIRVHAFGDSGVLKLEDVPDPKPGAAQVRGQAKPAETVFVHGATGGVGIAAVQLARSYGCTVIGTGGSDAGRKLVLEQGAHHVLDHHTPDYLKQLMALTENRGADVILEMLA